MADIRDLVKHDQGWIKKVQSVLPGYKKYRNCEDLRAADSLLRQGLSLKLKEVEDLVKESRKEISRSMDMDLLNLIGEVVNLSHRITEKVRHAQQGYSPWISGDIRIEEDELNILYQFDLSMFKKVEDLKKEADGLLDSCRQNSPDRQDRIGSLKRSLLSLEGLFNERTIKITQVAQE